jgi:phage-related protein
MDTVVVLHSFSKTTNGVDQPAMNLAKQRLKELHAEIRANSK